MASNMIAAQHNCRVHLKFILPDDMVTVDLEVITLTGADVYRKDRNCSEKRFLPWSKENTPPPEFLKKVKETKGERSKEFWNQFWTKMWNLALGLNPLANVPN